MTARLIALTLLLLLGCEGPADDGQTWRFAIEEASGSVQDRYAQRFAEEIHERTDGEVRVVVYPTGSLGTSDHITEQLHMGTIELAMSSPGHLGKLIPEVQVFLLHFVLGSDSEVNARALRDPELRAFLDGLYAEKGLAFLTAFGEGAMAWTTQEAVRDPGDFAGLRMRVMTSPLLLASYEAYGASPTPLPYGEVYTALELEMIDGQVNPVFAIEESSFHEVIEVLTFPHHAEFVTTLAANPAWLEGLPEARRELVRDVVDELQLEIYETQRDLNEERLAIIREERPDIEVVELSEQEQAAFRRAASPVRRQYVDMVGPRGQEMLEHLEAAVERAEAQAPAE